MEYGANTESGYAVLRFIDLQQTCVTSEHSFLCCKIVIIIIIINITNKLNISNISSFCVYCKVVPIKLWNGRYNIKVDIYGKTM
ncbi:hypothetical protein M8J75_010254 [Diaphorina citri]|nr:hypothetical protein M8J75_010254 [Diaphorina citri]